MSSPTLRISSTGSGPYPRLTLEEYAQQAEKVTQAELMKLVQHLTSNPAQYIKAQKRRIREDDERWFGIIHFAMRWIDGHAINAEDEARDRLRELKKELIACFDTAFSSDHKRTRTDIDLNVDSTCPIINGRRASFCDVENSDKDGEYAVKKSTMYETDDEFQTIEKLRAALSPLFRSVEQARRESSLHAIDNISPKAVDEAVADALHLQSKKSSVLNINISIPPTTVQPDTFVASSSMPSTGTHKRASNSMFRSSKLTHALSGGAAIDSAHISQSACTSYLGMGDTSLPYHNNTWPTATANSSALGVVPDVSGVAKSVWKKSGALFFGNNIRPDSLDANTYIARLSNNCDTSGDRQLPDISTQSPDEVDIRRRLALDHTSETKERVIAESETMIAMAERLLMGTVDLARIPTPDPDVIHTHSDKKLLAHTNTNMKSHGTVIANNTHTDAKDGLDGKSISENALGACVEMPTVDECERGQPADVSYKEEDVSLLELPLPPDTRQIRHAMATKPLRRSRRLSGYDYAFDCNVDTSDACALKDDERESTVERKVFSSKETPDKCPGNADESDSGEEMENMVREASPVNIDTPCTPRHQMRAFERDSTRKHTHPSRHRKHTTQNASNKQRIEPNRGVDENVDTTNAIASDPRRNIYQQENEFSGSYGQRLAGSVDENHIGESSRDKLARQHTQEIVILPKKAVSKQNSINSGSTKSTTDYISPTVKTMYRPVLKSLLGSNCRRNLEPVARRNLKANTTSRPYTGADTGNSSTCSGNATMTANVASNAGILPPTYSPSTVFLKALKQKFQNAIENTFLDNTAASTGTWSLSP
eukprot:CFRG0465T1